MKYETTIVSLAVTICFVAFIGGSMYGCQVYNKTWYDVRSDCIKAGGTWRTAVPGYGNESCWMPNASASYGIVK